MRLDRGEAAVALRVVYAGMAAYAVLFVFAAVVHYAVFKEPRVRPRRTWSRRSGTRCTGTSSRRRRLNGHQRDRLGFHVDPFLLLFVPLFWIWSSPLLLLVVQALAVASGALAGLLARAQASGLVAGGAHFAFAYLLYPATQFNAFTIADSFHSVSIAVPLVLYAVWFLDEDRLVAFSVVALLACTTKEEIPLAVGCSGSGTRSGRGIGCSGSSVFAAGLAITLFNFLWVIPHFSPTGV